MHIGLPSPTATGTQENNQFAFHDEEFENASETSSFAYDQSHNTSTLPATHKQ